MKNEQEVEAYIHRIKSDIENKIDVQTSMEWVLS